MTKYHISPETGRPNICRAEIKDCPLTDDKGNPSPHYDSKEEARAGYEESMKEKVLPTLNRSDDTIPMRKASFLIYGANYDRAVAKIEAANRKLERAGITEKFEYETEEKILDRKTPNGAPVRLQYYAFTLSAPVISYTHNGERYDFEAVMQQEDAGIITKSARGVELNGYRVDSLVCDHCGQKRKRSKTFLIKDSQGNRHQIGSGCIDAYFGVKPEGLWALTYNPFELLEKEDSDSPAFKNSEVYDVRETLAYALAASHNGQGFVSRATAEEYGKISTADMVHRMRHINIEQEEHKVERLEQLKIQAQAFLNNGRVDEVLNEIQQIPGNSDYITNIKTLAKGKFTKKKSQTMLISAIGALNREERLKKQREEAEKAKAAKREMFSHGHFGQVNEKIAKGTTFKVLDNAVYSSYDNYYGIDVEKSRMVLQDEEGHQIVWFASRKINLEKNDDFIISSGKVKKHGQYDGIDQTIIGNVRLLNEKE